MTEETARKAVDLSVAASASAAGRDVPSVYKPDLAPEGKPGDSQSTGICFFGGEPLLLRSLIMNTVKYCSSIHKQSGHPFFFKLVTNGTLLDESFLEFADKYKIGIGFSHDGLMQDDSRIFPDGSGSADLLDSKIRLILSHQQDAIVMCTVSPDSVGKFADSVEWLFEKGFRRIYTTPAVGEKACWTDETLAKLGEEYRKISKLYIKWTARGERFYFPAFDTKIETHIMGDLYRHKTCRFGQKQLSVAPDGSIYPCIQFVGEPAYKMGDVFSGIIDNQRKFVIEQGKREPDICKSCALRTRCQYNCCCRNKHMTGQINQVSAFTCGHEQQLIRYADEAANALYKKQNETFIKKQYENRLRAEAWESL